MKSAVFVTLAMGAAAMHIPWLSHNDNNKQTPMLTMTEDDAVMNAPLDETRMPAGQGFNGMGSTGGEIDVHVSVQVSHRDANTMVSLDTPSHPDSPIGAAGARHNDQSPSGMRTTYQSMNQDQGDDELCLPVCYESEPRRCEQMLHGAYPKELSKGCWTCCQMVTTDPPKLVTNSGGNLMPGGSSSSSNSRTDKMPGGGPMDAPQATPKGMQIMGSDTGMYGHEVCREIIPDIPIYFQCPPPAYIKSFEGGTELCCYWSDDRDTLGNADSRSGIMMSGKKANLDL